MVRHEAKGIEAVVIFFLKFFETVEKEFIISWGKKNGLLIYPTIENVVEGIFENKSGPARHEKSVSFPDCFVKMSEDRPLLGGELFPGEAGGSEDVSISPEIFGFKEPFLGRAGSNWDSASKTKVLVSASLEQ